MAKKGVEEHSRGRQAGGMVRSDQEFTELTEALYHQWTVTQGNRHTRRGQRKNKGQIFMQLLQRLMAQSTLT